MSTKFPNIRDLPDGLDAGVEGVLSDMKECFELMLSRRSTYLPVEDYEPANKQYADSLGFIDRGDPSGYDFELADFTTDGTWQTGADALDLSNIVPSDAKAVLLGVMVLDGSVAVYLQLRESGNSAVYNKGTVRTQLGGTWNDADVTVPYNSDQKVEYITSNTTFTGINVTVKGWWK